MCLASRLVGKGVDDRKQRCGRPEREPGHGLGLVLSERQGVYEECRQLLFLPGLRLEPDDQACGDHCESSFVSGFRPARVALLAVWVLSGGAVVDAARSMFAAVLHGAEGRRYGCRCRTPRATTRSAGGRLA